MKFSGQSILILTFNLLLLKFPPPIVKIPSTMFSLVYRSTAAENFVDVDIQKMLENAKIYNEKKEITGCLLYHNHTFIQLLEGEENEVRKLYRKIKKDTRHHDICVLHIEENLNPLFSKFSMV